MTTPLTPSECELMQLVADYCTLRVIDALREGEMRFNQILRAIGDANTVTLTNRLKKLEAAGIIQRHVETLDKQSVTYSLTTIGTNVLPIVDGFHRLTIKLKGQ